MKKNPTSSSDMFKRLQWGERVVRLMVSGLHMGRGDRPSTCNGGRYIWWTIVRHIVNALIVIIMQSHKKSFIKLVDQQTLQPSSLRRRCYLSHWSGLFQAEEKLGGEGKPAYLQSYSQFHVLSHQWFTIDSEADRNVEAKKTCDT